MQVSNHGADRGEFAEEVEVLVVVIIIVVVSVSSRGRCGRLGSRGRRCSCACATRKRQTPVMLSNSASLAQACCYDTVCEAHATRLQRPPYRPAIMTRWMKDGAQSSREQQECWVRMQEQQVPSPGPLISARMPP